MPKAIPSKFLYPESDGKPMAENTVQFEWIVTIKCNLDTQYRDDPDVFVAGDLFWYPVEGRPEIVQAPDTLVAFGRPKGDRSSYRQWEEGGIAPQVIFEVMSPGNSVAEMQKKFQFYDRHQAEEYYIYDPDRGHLNGWLRGPDGLRAIAEMNGWQSPRLGVRFEMSLGVFALYHPDGGRFQTFLEIDEQRTLEIKARKVEESARKLAEWERDKEKRIREEVERDRSAVVEAADKLRAQLRALGIEPQS